MNIYTRRITQSIYALMLCALIVSGYVARLTDLRNTIYASSEEKYIKWIDFDVTANALWDAAKYDIDSYNSDSHIDFITLLSLLGSKYGGDFKHYKKSDIDKIYQKLCEGISPEEIASNIKTYNYYKSIRSCTFRYDR